MFESGVKVNYNNVKMHNNYAMELKSAGRFEEAQKHYLVRQTNNIDCVLYVMCVSTCVRLQSKWSLIMLKSTLIMAIYYQKLKITMKQLRSETIEIVEICVKHFHVITALKRL